MAIEVALFSSVMLAATVQIPLPELCRGVSPCLITDKISLERHEQVCR